ncbi:MAG: efflux RND transporter permease subunit [Candidatus Doudnabacteria bacterium]|nr:efflux RND transporter permease subunit [Candidatus Doudnabacteria bacterium]
MDKEPLYNNQPESQTPRTTDQLYLDKLEFNPKLRESWLNFFVSNFRVVLLIIILLTGVGLYSFFKLPRESNPEVKIPIAVVITTLPGASPGDVEQLITQKIETKIAGLTDLDKVTSVSSNSVSAITVQFNANADLTNSIRDLRDDVNNALPDLPKQASTPVVNQISLDDQPVLEVAVTGPYDGFTMYSYAQTLRQELEKVPGVREADISGGDQKEYQVAYYPDRLIAYNISADQANAAIANTNIAIPSGTFDALRFEYSVRTDSRVFSTSDIAAIPVTQAADGSTVTIGDLANVSVTAITKSTLARLSTAGSKPQAAITIGIIKRTGSSVLDTVAQAKASMDATIKTFGPGVHYDVTQDSASDITQSFSELQRDFIITLLLVFGILFIIVGLKEALVAGLAIPLVFLATFTALLQLGISLNFLSLFSLILALGLLVDDAIVVVSATKQYMRTGKYTPEEAVLLVLNDFKVVLTTTTLTTVWAFLPLLYSTGIIGQYIKSIPVTVSITLVSSLLIALMVNHPLAAVLERVRLTKKFFYLLEALVLLVVALGIYFGGWFGYILAGAGLIGGVFMVRWYEKGGKETLAANQELVNREWKDDELIKEKLRNQSSHKDTNLGGRLMHGILHFDIFLPIYERYLRDLLATKKRRVWTIVVTVLVFIGAVLLPVFGLVKSEFFPAADSNYVFIDITAPTGLKLTETDKVAQAVESRLLKYPEIANFATISGGVSPMSQNRAGDNTAAIDITLKDKSQRKLKSYQLADIIRQDLSNVSGAKIEVSTASGGPPSGAAFQAQISGDDLPTLSSIARDLENRLVQIPGVVSPDISLKDAAPQYTFELNPTKLAQYKLTSANVGSILRMAIAGTEVSDIAEGNNEVKIIATFAPQSIPDLASVQNLQIVNPQGQPVFLKDVATISLTPGVDAITRINQKRTVLLTANVTTQTNSNLVLAAFQKKIADYKFPSGYSISYGGENEQNQQSVQSIIDAMAIAILLIVATLIVQFNSFRKAFIVLVTIPLALIGVFVGMALLGVSLSFPGLIGILALFGIVVKNAIILMDKINLNLRSGIGFLDSIVDAGKSRLEAIFITSICTIFGILPITLSNETWTSLGSAVIFGLLLSSFLTLFIIPTLFYMMIPEDAKH